jgi:hypothetical protein
LEEVEGVRKHHVSTSAAQLAQLVGTPLLLLYVEMDNPRMPIRQGELVMAIQTMEFRQCDRYSPSNANIFS